MTKDVLIKTLLKEVTTVTFTKKDGSIRVMNCTRNMNLIPAEFHPKTNDESTSESSDNIRVFDVDKQGWRSFNYNSIVS